MRCVRSPSLPLIRGRTSTPVLQPAAATAAGQQLPVATAGLEGFYGDLRSRDTHTRRRVANFTPEVQKWAEHRLALEVLRRSEELVPAKYVYLIDYEWHVPACNGVGDMLFCDKRGTAALVLELKVLRKDSGHTARNQRTHARHKVHEQALTYQACFQRMFPDVMVAAAVWMGSGSLEMVSSGRAASLWALPLARL